MTKQKHVLYDAIKSFTTFFDAAQFHKKVETKNIGIATIYRFLNNLEARGEIHSYICNNRKIYSIGVRNHTHFTCKQCGKTIHINIKNIDFIKNVALGEVCHFQLDITGVCKKCSLN